MTTFDPAAYGHALEALLRDAPLNPLGPGRPDAARRPPLVARGGRRRLPAPARRGPRHGGRLPLAGLWLLYEFLDESHAISQELHTAEGSYWHALMHRRENDFSNSKYWFRRVGGHAVFEPLRLAAHDLAGEAPHPSARFLTTQSAWDPYAFVDLCEASLSGRAPCEALCRRVQQSEWSLLFDYCYRVAVGPGA